MSSHFLTYMSGQGYVSLWSKYRPAILKLMVDSASEPQQYKFFKHEFSSLDTKDKAYDFTLKLIDGKAEGATKITNTAKDLFDVLNQSEKGRGLINEYNFTISMDKKFILQISRDGEQSKSDPESTQSPSEE